MPQHAAPPVACLLAAYPAAFVRLIKQISVFNDSFPGPVIAFELPHTQLSCTSAYTLFKAHTPAMAAHALHLIFIKLAGNFSNLKRIRIRIRICVVVAFAIAKVHTAHTHTRTPSLPLIRGGKHMFGSSFHLQYGAVKRNDREKGGIVTLWRALEPSLSHAYARALSCSDARGARFHANIHMYIPVRCVAHLCHCHLARTRMRPCTRLPVISCFMLFRVKSVCVAGVAISTHTPAAGIRNPASSPNTRTHTNALCPR